MRCTLGNRRILLATALVLLVSLIAGGCTPDKATSPGQAPPPTGDDPTSRAVRYLVNQGDKVDFAAPLFFDYFDRKFGLRYFGTQIEHSHAAVSRGPSMHIYRYARIFDRKIRLDQYPTPEAAGITATTMIPLEILPLEAIHCDTFPLPSTFLGQVASESARGDYYTTHAAWALQMAIEQGCVTEAEARPLKDDLEKSLTAIPGYLPVVDAYIEALAILFYIGRGSAVKAEWIQAMLSAQRPDGSFGAAGEEASHPTMLALWMLLEYQNRNAQPTTLIVDPGPPAR